MLRRALAFLPLWLVLASTLAAGDPALRDGANHHLGDDSFVAAFGRAPTAEDSEDVRMHTHLAYVRARLGAAPSTQPALAARRAELLGYLDDYIAKGTTPRNTYLPWRTPVFIDADDKICAVGYLIERSVGRALAEKIATSHRFAFVEDIAAAEPAVRAWIASSGLTLTEIASIQPAYADPRVDQWHTWDLAKHRYPDGAYTRPTVTGAWSKQKMTGAWRVVDASGATIGAGTLRRGAGAWTGFYPNGGKRAEGRYAANRAEGRWTLYHPSGRLAAEGRFANGVRIGRWAFYYDTAAKTPLARGAFAADGSVTGTWRHFDADGALLATTWTETPAQWGDTDLGVDGGEGFVLDLGSDPDGFTERIHLGTPHSYPVSLTMLARGDERIYVHSAVGVTTIYDAGGHRLARDVAGAWHARDCRWARTREAIARTGDVARLHGLLYQDLLRRVGKIAQFDGPSREDTGPVCGAAVTVAAGRGVALDALLAARDRVRSPAPDLVREAVLRSPMFDEAEPLDAIDEPASDDADATYARERWMATRDLAHALASGMGSYLEWAHVDGLFVGAFRTMPGVFMYSWAESDPEDATGVTP